MKLSVSCAPDLDSAGNLDTLHRSKCPLVFRLVAESYPSRRLFEQKHSKTFLMIELFTLLFITVIQSDAVLR